MKTIKQKLEEIWNDPGVISPNGMTEWRVYSKSVRARKDRDAATFHGLFAIDETRNAGIYSIRHGDY